MNRTHPHPSSNRQSVLQKSPWRCSEEVVAVGPGAKTEGGKLVPMDVKVGDTVLFGKWSGTEIKIDNKEYSIMKETDIMGISKGK